MDEDLEQEDELIDDVMDTEDPIDDVEADDEFVEDEESDDVDPADETQASQPPVQQRVASSYAIDSTEDTEYEEVVADLIDIGYEEAVARKQAAVMMKIANRRSTANTGALVAASNNYNVHIAQKYPEYNAAIQQAVFANMQSLPVSQRASLEGLNLAHAKVLLDEAQASNVSLTDIILSHASKMKPTPSAQKQVAQSPAKVAQKQQAGRSAALVGQVSGGTKKSSSTQRPLNEVDILLKGGY